LVLGDQNAVIANNHQVNVKNKKWLKAIFYFAL